MGACQAFDPLMCVQGFPLNINSTESSSPTPTLTQSPPPHPPLQRAHWTNPNPGKHDYTTVVLVLVVVAVVALLNPPLPEDVPCRPSGAGRRRKKIGSRGSLPRRCLFVVGSLSLALISLCSLFLSSQTRFRRVVASSCDCCLVYVEPALSNKRVVVTLRLHCAHVFSVGATSFARSRPFG